jgi:hypothetical protein
LISGCNFDAGCRGECSTFWFASAVAVVLQRCAFDCFCRRPCFVAAAFWAGAFALFWALFSPLSFAVGLAFRFCFLTRHAEGFHHF